MGLLDGCDAERIEKASYCCLRGGGVEPIFFCACCGVDLVGADDAQRSANESDILQKVATGRVTVEERLDDYVSNETRIT